MATSPGEVDLSENHQARLYGVFISTYVLAVIAVCLRLSARKWCSKAGLWLDDYAICASLVFATGYFVDMIIWVQHGVGRHIELYGPEGVKNFYTGLFICSILFPFTLGFTKYSILLFYLRIFGKTKIRIPLAILGLIVTGWAIAVLFASIFQCNPVQGFWDRSLNADCTVNVHSFFIGNAVPNVVTDWALLLLPIPFVWSLNMERAQKIALCGAFALGGFTCVISIVRLYIMSTQLSHNDSQDVTWIFIGSSIWTAVEVNIGIVSACLPSLRPLLVAVLDNPMLPTRNRVSLNEKTPQPTHLSQSTHHDPWPGGCRGDPYIRAGSDSERDSTDTAERSWPTVIPECSRDVLVRHDISVVQEKRESGIRNITKGLDLEEP